MTAQLPLEPQAMLPLRRAYEEAGYAARGITFAQVTSGKREFRHLFLALKLRASSMAKQCRSIA